MISVYTVLGLEENAAPEQVEQAYKHLLEVLKPNKFPENDKARQQADKCVKAVEGAYKTLKNPDLKRVYKEKRSEYLKGEKSGDTRPRLGQLCVASGMISMDQLREAVESQLESGLPLGEVLQEKQFISQAELDGLLLGQEMIDVPCAVTEPVAVRLIALGLMTEDMGLVAQMEKRALDLPTGEIVARHGWVEPQLLKVLTLE